MSEILVQLPVFRGGKLLQDFIAELQLQLILLLLGRPPPNSGFAWSGQWLASVAHLSDLNHDE